MTCSVSGTTLVLGGILAAGGAGAGAADGVWAAPLAAGIGGCGFAAESWA